MGVGGGEGAKMSKTMTPPPFFGSKIMNLLVFFDFEPKKCFQVPTAWGFMGRSGTSACAVYAFFSAIFAMVAVLATSVTPCHPL